jgi:hypothetical protein
LQQCRTYIAKGKLIEFTLAILIARWLPHHTSTHAALHIAHLYSPSVLMLLMLMTLTQVL